MRQREERGTAFPEPSSWPRNRVSSCPFHHISSGITFLQMGELWLREGHIFNLGPPGSKTHACP